jgi:plastocyanin
MRKPTLAMALFHTVAGGLLAACGDDDGAAVRDCGGGSASGGSASAGSGSGAGASGSGACDEEVTGDDASGTAECTPVGEDLAADADSSVDIQLLDYAFAPAEVEVDAGVVTFHAENAGEENHELAFLPGDGEVPFTEPGAPDEDALAEAGAFELEAFPPGTTCDATFELEPGDYTLFCIVTAEDGETHYEKGMAGTLTVT